VSKVDGQEQAGDVVQDGGINSAPSKTTVTTADTGSPPVPNSAAPVPGHAFRARPFCQPRNHKLILTKRALLEIYGPNGPGLGETEQRCLKNVNDWMRKKDRDPVSTATLRRAKQELRNVSEAPGSSWLI
jgi:hypothetical protein